MSEFRKILLVAPLRSGNTWYLREEFSHDVGSKGSGGTIKVTVDFMIDWANIQRRQGGAPTDAVGLRMGISAARGAAELRLKPATTNLHEEWANGRARRTFEGL